MPLPQDSPRKTLAISIAGSYHTGRSKAADAQTCINWYPELHEVGGKTKLILLPTPGANQATTVGSGLIRGSLVHSGNLYFISSNTLYKMDVAETITTIGTINTTVGRVSMASNGTQGNQLMIVDGTVESWIYDSVANTFTKITDNGFPGNFGTPLKVNTVTFFDSYFLVTVEGKGQFYISALNDGVNWTSTDVATAERNPDNLQTTIQNSRELWLIGDLASEIWTNTGGDFPFEAYTNGFVDTGTAARFSVAKTRESIIFLSQDVRGKAQVVMSRGISLNRISNDAIESQLDTYATISDAFAFVYQQAGHTFYQITFPTEDVTWVCDLDLALQSTDIAWHQRRTGTEGRHLANTYSYFNGKHYVGDYRGNNIYFLDIDKYTDNGTNIIRERTGAHTVVDSRNKIKYYRFELEVESGVGNTNEPGKDPSIALSWSDDGGFTYSNSRDLFLGKKGQYNKRLLAHHLGSSRERIWKIVSGDPAKIVPINAYVEAEEAAH